jgi:MYXO-CTERM domain-containing protein
MRTALPLAFVLALSPSIARAHFILEEPASWRPQGPLGDPQKLGPCGDDGTEPPTGVITEYRPGDTVTVKINETVFHPGHYRIALSVNDRSELPPEPEVTAGSTPCGSVPIDPNPTFPVLGDGLLIHTKPFDEPQTIQVTLPSNVTCEKCTLQVIEFMSNHGLNNPGGCYYHHCADIAIRPATKDKALTETGSGCTSTKTPPEALALAGLATAWVVRRRQRRALPPPSV